MAGYFWNNLAPKFFEGARYDIPDEHMAKLFDMLEEEFGPFEATIPADPRGIPGYAE